MVAIKHDMIVNAVTNYATPAALLYVNTNAKSTGIINSIWLSNSDTNAHIVRLRIAPRTTRSAWLPITVNWVDIWLDSAPLPAFLYWASPVANAWAVSRNFSITAATVASSGIAVGSVVTNVETWLSFTVTKLTLFTSWTLLHTNAPDTIVEYTVNPNDTYRDIAWGISVGKVLYVWYWVETVVTDWATNAKYLRTINVPAASSVVINDCWVVSPWMRIYADQTDSWTNVTIAITATFDVWYQG